MIPAAGLRVRPAERGYALVAAVASITVFAAMALAIITATRASIAAGGGEYAAARAGLAAESAIETTLHALALGDETTLGLLGGGQLPMDVDGAQVIVRLADERGKVPLNHLEDAQVERLLAGAGLDGAQLAVARDSLLDWLDEDDLARPDGAEQPYYAGRGLAARNGNVLTIDELGAVRGFTPQVVARLRAYVTAEPDTVPFDSRFAAPEAVAVMDTAGASSVTAIDRQREAEGQRTAFQPTDRKDLLGKPITISADAATPDGGRAHREVVVVLGASAAHPWFIRRAF